MKVSHPGPPRVTDQHTGRPARRDAARGRCLAGCRKVQRKPRQARRWTAAMPCTSLRGGRFCSAKVRCRGADPKDGTPGVGWATGDTQKDADDEALTRCRTAAGKRRDFCKVINQLCDGSAK